MRQFLTGGTRFSLQFHILLYNGSIFLDFFRNLIGCSDNLSHWDARLHNSEHNAPTVAVLSNLSRHLLISSRAEFESPFSPHMSKVPQVKAGRIRTHFCISREPPMNTICHSVYNYILHFDLEVSISWIAALLSGPSAREDNLYDQLTLLLLQRPISPLWNKTASRRSPLCCALKSRDNLVIANWYQ